MMGPFDNALERLGIILPTPPKPVASYVPFVRAGNLVCVSGQLPSVDGKITCKGPVPNVISIDTAKEAAKLAMINAVAVLREACGGDLDQVKRIVRVGVFVQSADGFEQQPTIANGASDLLVAIFGDVGKHARAAVGTNALPLGATVEVELMAELK
jgi:enamine deaminase RidA (YjgF/YER057c/UK114 family)